MKIALAQTDIVLLEKEKNLEKAKEWIKKASEEKADLILFPEMSFTGFSMEVEKSAEFHMETVRKLCELTKEYKINIGAGYVRAAKESDEGEKKSEAGQLKGENHYCLIDRKGEMIMDYAKLHPFSYGKEDQYFNSGKMYVIGDVEEVPVSCFICYDLRFPIGFWRVAKDVHFMIVPANWPDRRIAQFDALLRARAIENQYYVIAINCVGQQGKANYNGHSVVYDPKGNQIAFAGEEENLLFVEIEDDVEAQRAKFPVMQDRRIEER